MIITKTPLRISFFSAGSDIPAFHENNLGAALSATINKYVYVILHPYYKPGIIQTKFDEVGEANINEVKHLITKNALELINPGFEIDKVGMIVTSISDIPTGGSGLGSSSAFTVGLAHALEINYVGDFDSSSDRLAENACKIEIDMCRYPIGKQDQYAAAHGGTNLFIFTKNSVRKNPITVNWRESSYNFLLYYTGISRNANDILQRQKTNMTSDPEIIKLVKNNVDRAFIGAGMLEKRQFDDFGLLLNEAWQDKKKLASGITTPYIDEIYQTAIEAGATGGKVLGAGGGGFILFYVPINHIKPGLEYIRTSGPDIEVKLALQKFPDLRECYFNFSDRGSRVYP